MSPKQYKQLEATGAIFDPETLQSEYEVAQGQAISPTSGMLAYNNPAQGFKALGRHPNSRSSFWAMVRYTLGENLSQWQKMYIQDAIRTIERETNARFYNATGLPTRDRRLEVDFPYVEFNYHPKYNNSHVGRIGGKQIINLNSFDEEVIIHEICHTLGMMHEQCRKYRDEYINIDEANIEDDAKHNFRKEKYNYISIGPLDFESVMMYDSYAFAKDRSKPTITRKDGTTFRGGRRLSENDRRFINRFYLPFIAREDICTELDSVAYDGNNRRLTTEEIAVLQSKLNVGRCNHMVTNPDHFGFVY